MVSAWLMDEVIRRALEEDLAAGDLTSEALIPEDEWAIAEVFAKSELVLSGSDVFARTFYLVSPSSRVEQLVPDGQTVAPGTLLLRADGPSRELLMAERTALNFLQRLSGTATLTKKYVEAAGGRARITDTRKTTPGLRAFERAAVRHGGGHNHRDSLGSAVLIKENHIAAVGGIRIAVERARASAPHTSRVEIEVRNLEELDEALAAGADIIMLDNFDDASVERATQRARGKALIEVSGGLTLERIPRLAALGVDVMSVGALTHSAPAADISLLLRRLEGGPPPRAPG
ncbi:MAG: nicotinate-nucleotide diphosphorylase (carboxylating) [Sorangiineae bacterium NIC37A_2]|jgi:nicotinate-nucleotide pyrophosphorylase (carboxylating)|nr:MAG: nicotinate-nucleotide diphosphorylase (carboxylating) [Sorangiineae bacterium NIC37A_2]